MKEYKNIYFIGIGGIGMSAIARYFHFKGKNVLGYDKTPSDLTKKLENEGISIHYSADINAIPKDTDNTLIIYTPAIPKDFEELLYVQNNNYTVIKRSQSLGEIAKGHNCLAVAGTHGKTSTTSIVANIMNYAGQEDKQQVCSAFLGGIANNFESNLVLRDGDKIVVEADEFDRSFLQLHPNSAVITSMDPDHLDIYNNKQSYIDGFKDFAKQVSDYLIIKKGLDISPNNTNAKLYTYHYKDSNADFYGKNHRNIDGKIVFDLVHPWGEIKNIHTNIPGWINAENAIAAASLCLVNKVKDETIKKGIESFTGVERRMQQIFDTEKIKFIDDYAHHPQEIEGAISSIKDSYPNKRLTVIFQPHLYTRTRDFAKGFASALSLADEIILLEIYPARELPIEGVNSQMLADMMTNKNVKVIKKEDLISYLDKIDIEVLVTLGAGDISLLVKPIYTYLTNR